MFRFILIVLVAAIIGLVLTNPTPDDVRAKLDSQLLSQIGGAGALPPSPVGQAVTSALGDKMQGQIVLERRNYYVLSLYKVTIAGKQLPGCLIGLAKQALPYNQC